ncbi:SAF domain-containing protein [Luteococcus sp.]|uniref:SAF domain-containing protein n=1 Tax=Luteococcus sp. TaxID=1969402 RepID=UPI003735BD14
MRISDFGASVARAVRWHRRPLAALCAACAVLLALTVLRPAPAATVDVLVAARALPAGSSLAAGDLRLAHYPPALVPDGALDDPGRLTGRVLASPVDAGLPLTEQSVVEAGQATRNGELLVPFRVQDPQVLAMVRVGDRVTVVSPGEDGQAVTLASRVRVASVPPAGGGGGSDQGLLVVSADPETASRLAAWAGGQGLGVALG